MKDYNSLYLTGFLFIIIILALLSLLVYYTCGSCETCENILEYSERCKMYNKSTRDTNDRINGVYFFKDEYYCVWLKDRDPLHINRTEAHEVCHHLVHKNNTHFCGEDLLSPNKKERG